MYSKLLFASLFALISFSSHAAQGVLDTSFGTGGKVTTTLGSTIFDQGNGLSKYRTSVRGIAVQSDGKVVAAGYAYSGGKSVFAVARYTASGLLDTTFGSGGAVLTSMANAGRARAVAIQADGKIIAVGDAFNAAGDRNQVALVRYTSSGTLDSTFGSSGKVQFSIGNYDDRAWSVALQPDGKIVLGCQGNGRFAIARFTTAGGVDSSFGSAGITTTQVGGVESGIYSIALQNDGRIVACGFSGSAPSIRLAIARYTTSGILDGTFGGGSGTVVFPTGTDNSIGQGVAVQPDGKILATGKTYNPYIVDYSFILVRLAQDGTADTTFGSAGTGVVTAPNGFGLALALQSDGRVLVAGRAYNFGSSSIDFALFRYTNSGVLDSTFGQGGKTYASFNTSDDCAFAVALQTGGKVLVGGCSGDPFYYADGGDAFAVARFNGDETESPVLVAPGAGAVLATSAATITYTLSESAKTGSLKLQFDDGSTTREWTLATVGEGAGTHSFSLNLLSPGSNPAVASGVPIPDGTYTLTLSYQDAASNPSANAVASGIVVTSKPVVGASTITSSSYSSYGANAALADVTIEFQVNPNGSATNGRVDVTPNAANGASGQSFNIAAGNASATVTKTFSLAPHGTYAFQAQATNTNGTTFGSVLNYTLPNQVPQAANLSITSPGPGQITYPNMSVTEADADPLTVTIAGAPAHGTVNITGVVPSVAPINQPPYTLVTYTYSAAADSTGNDSFQFKADDGHGGQVTWTVSITNAGPSATNDEVLLTQPIIGIPVLQNDTDDQGQPLLTVSAVGQGTYGAVSINGTAVTYAYAGGHAGGTDTFTYTTKDPFGLTATATVTVHIPADPSSAVVAQKAGGVPGAGSDSRIQTGAVWTGFGIPAINDAGEIAYLGKWSAPKSGTTPAQLGAGIFVNDVLVAKVGDNIPGAGVLTIGSVRDPLLAADGSAIFMATLKGDGVTTANDTALLSNVTGTLAVVLREGDVVPGTGGAVWKTFSSVAIASPAPAQAESSYFIGVVGRLQTGLAGAAGPGGATTKNDDMFIVARPVVGSDTMEVVPLIREGGEVSTPSGAKTVKTLTMLRTGVGSPGYGRQFKDGFVSALLGFTDGTKGYTLEGSDAVMITSIPLDVQHAGGTYLGANWQTLGLPALAPGRGGANPEDGLLSFSGQLKKKIGGVPTTGVSGVFVASLDTLDPVLVVQTTKPVTELSGTTWRALKDPVVGGSSIAFLATLGGAGVTTSNDGVLTMSDAEPGTDHIVAREGDQPPGAPIGAKWSRFISIAITNSATPRVIFTAQLQNRTPNPGGPFLPGPGGITSASDLGCWATGSDGILRALFREGTAIEGKSLKAYSFLGTTAGTAGSTRAFNDRGEIAWLATFSDNSTAIIKTQIP